MSKCTECISRHGYCPQDCTMTNADRIHSKTDEEFADFILDCAKDGFCPHPKEGFSACEPYHNCCECITAWLKQEVDG